MSLAILTFLMAISILITETFWQPVHWLSSFSLPTWLWLAAILAIVTWIMRE